MMLLRVLLLSGLAVTTQAETIAITNARVLTMSTGGDIDSGTVIVRDGAIAAVGKNVPVPKDARVIDAKGQILTPGMVATVTPLAINDTIGSGYAGRASTNPRLSAAFDVSYDVVPTSPQIGEARIEGVTRAVVTPNAPGGPNVTRIFGGQVAIIHLGEAADLTVRRHAAMFLDTGEQGETVAGGGQGALQVRLRQAFADARAYAKNRASFDMARMEEQSLSRADLEALIPVVEGREPLLVEVNRAPDIHHILTLAREQKVKIILSGAAEAWMVAEEIAAANVPVVIDAEENQAFTFDSLNATYENARILHDAGVLIAFKPSVARIVFLIRTPRFIAGRTARFGLSPHDALAAITINPARIFGFADRFGSIEQGKDADLVLWSGDPLETTTVARMVMIRGVEQSLAARNRQLRDRYIQSVLHP
jgi:imidazolonepropionase-like amidohydrolase